MPKILYLADSLALGGAERQLTLLVKYLPAPWDASVFSFDGGPFSTKLLEIGTKLFISKRKARFDPVPVLHLWKLIRNSNPAIIHSWGWMSSAIAAPIAKLLNIKMIDGSIRRGSAPSRNILRARLSFFLADRVVANSQAGLFSCGISQSKGRVIYNAIDPQRLENILPNQRTRRAPTTVIMAARMTAVKDYATYIEGARELNRQKTGNWLFIALGAGNTRKHQIAEASDLISAGVMQFPEPVDDIMPYLLKSDIGVLLTNSHIQQEGLSNSIMEYMACGLPVVCNHSGGNCEIVAHGQNGLIIPTANISEFVHSLNWLQENPEQALQMGETGRKRVLQSFTVERMLREYTRLYEEVLNI